MLACDAAQIEQLIINLVKNAVEATLEQRASGRADIGVRLAWRRTGSMVELWVEDDGPSTGAGGADPLWGGAS